jgi:hypothetical protein
LYNNTQKLCRQICQKKNVIFYRATKKIIKTIKTKRKTKTKKVKRGKIILKTFKRQIKRLKTKKSRTQKKKLINLTIIRFL